MIIGLHHVGRVVTDLDVLAEQLEVLTGWPVTRHAPADDPFVAGRTVTGTARAHGPNGWIELIGVRGEVAPRRGVHDAGVTHAAIQVPRIDEVVERIAHVGIGRHSDPVALGTGFLYLYVRDAEHLVTEVEGAPHAPAELDAWLSHGAIATPDIARLRTAYQGLVGTEDHRAARLGGLDVVDEVTGLDGVHVTANWVPVANGSVELWEYHAPATAPAPPVDYETPGAGHLAFESDDLGSDLSRAVDAGFVLRDDPAGQDAVTVARLTDPDGNWVELLAFADPDDDRSLLGRPDLHRAARMDELLAAQTSGSRRP